MTESVATRAFGKFQLIRLLGQGGFGEVWLARDPQENREIALKILHQGLMSDGHFIKNVQREAGLTQKIDHPNVVKILEIGETAGRMYLAMEYIDGGTLEDAIETRQRWSTDQVLMLISQVASALDATHAQGVVHRDVKPANILVDAQGQAHLVDFGLAHAAMSSIGASANSVGMGTAAYMSPEQAGGQTGDLRADIYSLGVIAYELLTGQLPFQADTLMGYMMAHQNESPVYPAKLNPGISRELQATVLKALQKAPADRYKTAGTFSAALQKAAAQKFHKAPTRPPSRAGRTLRGIAVLLLLLALSIGAVATGIVPLPAMQAGVAPVGLPAGETEPSVPIAAPDTATPTPTEAPTGTPTPEDTATPTPAPEEPTPTSTATPTATATATAAPTDTPTATATPEPQTSLDGEVEIPPAYELQVVSGSTESGKGKLIVQIVYGNQNPVRDRRVRIYTQKQDISGNWVIDQSITDRYTDNAGVAEFSLPPAQYIVRVDLPGYNWGNAYDVQGLNSVPLESGRVTQLRLAMAQLVVGFRFGDGTAVTDQRVRVYRQKLDVGGKWVRDDNAVADGYTDNGGTVVYNVVPGYYIIQSDLRGYNWGDANDVKGIANFAAPPGTVTPLIYDLGSLTIGLTSSDGSALVNKRVRVRYQTTDVSGKAIAGDVVADGYTDNGGLLTFHFTPGAYVIQIDNDYSFDIPIENGKITQWDGRNTTVVSP